MSNNYQWSTERIRLKPKPEVLELNQMSNIACQLAALNKRFDRYERANMSVAQTNIVYSNSAVNITWSNALVEELQWFSR